MNRFRTSGRSGDVATMHRRDAIAGALLGLVIGERLNGAARAGLGTVAGSALAIAERLSFDDEVCDGELARLIVEQGDADPRYERELGRLFAYWEAGMPLDLAALRVTHAHGGGGSDFAAAVLVPLAFPHGTGTEREAVVRRAAAIVDGDPAGVDGAAVLARSLIAAMEGADVLEAGRRAALTPQLRRAMQVATTLTTNGVRPASLCEHFDTGSGAPDAVTTALYCVRMAPTFVDAVGDAFDATSTDNAVPALAGALAGARFGAATIDGRLLTSVESETRGRVWRAATALAARAAAAQPSTARLS